MTRANILILTCSLNIGGAEKHVYDLVSNMDKRKHNFIIICLYELGVIGKNLSRGHEAKVYHNLMRNKLDIFGVLKLISILRNEDIDILYILHTPLTLFLGVLCAKLTGIRVSIIRSPTTIPTAHRKRRRIVNLLFLNFVDIIIAQAYSQREYFIHHDSADPKKVTVIYNGVDVERFSNPSDESALRKAIGIPSGVHVVGIVARLEPQKGLTLFLNSARMVLDLFPNVYFLILGDGGERNNLEQMCKELSIQKNVLFLGMVKDVSQIVSLFNVAVLASRPVGETFSNAILEYMAASKPVIATNVGSIAEQVIDGETGYLIEYDDSAALTEAILKLLNDMHSARRMGEAGRRMVEEKFTIQKMINEYERLFVNIAK
jgi:glycosyltransferase involved in cell wall biosynthesis